jgi:hypothetical protein
MEENKALKAWDKSLRILEILMDGSTSTQVCMEILGSVQSTILIDALEQTEKEKRESIIESLKEYLQLKSDIVYREIVEYFNK